MGNIKKQIESLSKLSEIVDLEVFYSVGICDYSSLTIKLQGHCSSKALELVNQLGIKLKHDIESPFLRGELEYREVNYNIVLS